MALTNSERQARYIQRLKERAQLTPKLARQWTEELCLAWDAIEPMEEPWRKLLANRDSVAAALKTLNELARPKFAKTEDQRLALSRVRLLLDALALRDLSDEDFSNPVPDEDLRVRGSGNRRLSSGRMNELPHPQRERRRRNALDRSGT